MKIDSNLTDEVVIAELGRRLARWRLERNLSQTQFGELAGIGRRTIQRLEAGEPVQLASFIRALRALGLLDSLELLVPEPTPSPLQRLQLAGRERRRAGRGRGSEPDRGDESAEPWSWGEEDERR
jgi:transcriptional regulator with XRE-family HTH domain